ncbi:MAG: tRNA pseudouridine(55) synthase TruB [Bacteroidia bacterium]|nr:tRNA pseudouridine(55) synthase TruB [Bacteroidia bacterium]
MSNITPEPARVILIDKPFGWSSFQAVKKVKYELKSKKIGHAGTLDPLATGLLIMCTGKMTKSIEEIQAQPKEYTGTFVLGETTPSFDLETETDAHYPTEHITHDLLQETLKQFIGEIEQTPPLFSAVKIDGQRAYEIARKGGSAEIKSKIITIYEFELTRIELPQVDFRVKCGKGTYIRSLARDFGIALNSGAYLTNLRRTKIGDYCVEDATHPKSVQDQIVL